MGMSMIGLIVLVVIAVVVIKVIMLFASGFGGRKAAPSDGGNQAHPRLNQCPGCGAPLDENLDACPHCGLRVSN